MCRKLFFLVSFVLVLGLAGNTFGGVIYDWDNSYPATGDRLWTTATNWDPDGGPGDGDLFDFNYDPNIGAPNGPLITDGMDITIGDVLNSMDLASSDDYTTRNEPNEPDPNACIVTMTGGSLTLNGYFNVGSSGYGVFNMDGGNIIIHGGGKFKFGKNEDSIAVFNMNGGTFDYTEGSAGIPKNYGQGRLNMNGGVMMLDNLDMESVGDYAGNSGIVDYNGGTMILNEDRLTRIAGYASDGYLLAFGMPHGSIDSSTGLRAVVNANYDVTNAGKTTIVAALVDPNKPYSPNPGDGTTAGLDPNSRITLSWGEITGATLRDVYYGNNEADVNNGTGGTFQGNQAAKTWYTPVLGLDVTRYWRIDEYVPVIANLLEDDFGGTPWDANWTNVNWIQDTVVYNSPSSSASTIGAGGTSTLTSGSLNASDACSINIEFMYQKDDTEVGEVFLYYTDDGSTYNLIADLDTLGSDDEWLSYTDTITDSNYFTSNFGIRFESICDKTSETLWVDDVVVEKATSYDVYTGDVWKFTTGNYLTVDNFNQYVDSTDLQETWTSGEVSEIYLVDGAMEIRYFYTYSCDEAGRTPADADWTREGVKSLSVEFKGDPNNSAVEMYVRVNGVEVTYPGNPNDFKLDEWQECNIDLEDFTGVDMNNVTNITIGFRGGSDTDSLGFPTILLDNIRLYLPRCVTEHRSVADIAGDGCVVDYEDLDVLTEDWLIGDYNIVTSAPSTTGLVAHYQFEGSLNDSSANALHGTGVGGATTVSDAERGNVLKLDGNGDYVDCGNNALFNLTGPMTVAAWIKVNTFSRKQQFIVGKGGDTWRLERFASDDTIKFGHDGPTMTLEGTAGETPVDDGEWHHVAGVYDLSKTYVYVDGALDNSIDVTGSIKVDANEVIIGENMHEGKKGRWFDGYIDEVRIYARALPQAEIASLADDMAKPDDAAGDGYKYVPVLSDAELYSGESRDSRFVNFRDFAILAADYWLQETTWP